MSFVSRFAAGDRDVTVCRHCSTGKQFHVGPSFRCPDNSRREMYGDENPMVQWLKEHAPREVRQPADVKFQGDTDV